MASRGRPLSCPSAWLGVAVVGLLTRACAGGPEFEAERAAALPHGDGPADAGLASEGREEEVCAATSVTAPAGCLPNAPATWLVDCDGDGFPGAQVTACNPETVLGFDSGGPPGRFDCDDANSEIYPSGPEQWGDGVDSDCDGAEAPGCDAFEAENVGAGAPVPVRDCPASGVYFSEVVDCPHPCSEQASWVFVALANSGGSPQAGPIRIGWRDERGNSGTVDVEGALGSGESSMPIRIERVHSVGVELWVEEGGGSCASGEARVQVEPVRMVCVR